MTLTVAEPAASGIRTYDSGLKVIRLHEYLGAARGTLTTLTDSLSIVDPVVSDTQTLAVATTLTGRGGSAADTVVIPVADMGISNGDIGYYGYIGIRAFGRPPVDARAGEVWNSQTLSVGPAVCRVHDSTVYEYYPVPREHWRGYTFLRVGFYSLTYLGATTNVRFRAFGISGGSMEYRLDLMYLVPQTLAATDFSGTVEPNDYSPLYLGGGGFLGPDADSDTNNSIGTAHSVMPDRYFDSVWSWDVGYDLQDAEYEKSIQDWNNVFSSDLTGTKSYFIFPVGSRSVDNHTITSEDFSSWPGASPTSSLADTTDKYVMEGTSSSFPGVNEEFVAGATPCWYLMNSTLQFLGPKKTGTLGVFPFSDRARSGWSIGTRTPRVTALGAGGSSNPQNIAPLIQGFDSFIGLYKINLLMSHAGADVEMHFGAARWSAINTAHQTRVEVTATISHHTDGTHAISLVSHQDTSTTFYTFDGPVTVMGALAPGGSYWVRVEKRYNHWRARCWVDGDTEPGTWDVEGFAPAHVFRSGPGAIAYVDHPYDTNWPNDVTNVYEDPRFWHGSTGGFTPWMPEGDIHCLAGFDTEYYHIQIDEVTLTYDHDFEGGGTSHTGAYFHAEKWDESVDWGTEYIPPGSWRMITSDLAQHHYDNDTHGGNISAWKESGGYPLQVAAWSTIHFRRPAVTFIPQIYRRPYG